MGIEGEWIMSDRINIAIVDDEKIQAELLEKYVFEILFWLFLLLSLYY